MLNNHIHILIEILPKYSVAQVRGYIREKVHCIAQCGCYRARNGSPPEPRLGHNLIYSCGGFNTPTLGS